MAGCDQVDHNIATAMANSGGGRIMVLLVAVECLVATEAKLFIALAVVIAVVDPGKIIPDPEQMGVVSVPKRLQQGRVGLKDCRSEIRIMALIDPQSEKH